MHIYFCRASMNYSSSDALGVCPAGAAEIFTRRQKQGENRRKEAVRGQMPNAGVGLLLGGPFFNSHHLFTDRRAVYNHYNENNSNDWINIWPAGCSKYRHFSLYISIFQSQFISFIMSRSFFPFSIFWSNSAAK